MKIRSVVAFCFVLSFPFFCVLGCSSSSAPGNTSSTDPDMDASPGPADAGGVTFTQVYSDIISNDCLPCHAPGGVGASAGGLDMSTQALGYANLQKSASGSSCAAGAPKRVIPGNAAMSLLVEKLMSNPPCGLEMPYGCGSSAMPCLTAGQVEEVAQWINGGAAND
jgi:hypothetical protein